MSLETVQIPLSGGKAFAIVDAADAVAIQKFKWQVEARGQTFYAVRTTSKNGKNIKIYMHREILGLIHASVQADHINKDGLDNTRANLRPCSAKENTSNTRRFNNKEFRGVYASRNGKFRARLHSGGIHHGLGTFGTAKEAARAYDAKAREVYGVFALTNFEVSV
jgi:hypothetical protein